MDKIDNPPSKYSYKTRIGNWYEEQELDDNKMKDHMLNVTDPNLKTLNLEFKKNLSNRKAKLSKSENNYLSNNSNICIFSKETKSLLSSNPNTLLNQIELSYNCSFSNNLIAANRNVLKIILKEQIYPQNPNILKYGDKFYLETIDGLFPRNMKLYLSSKTNSHNSYAKLSKKQEINIQRDKTYNCVWEFEYLEYQDRILYKGEPIDISKPLLLKHTLTGNWLASNSKFAEVNTFGKEFEAYCFSHLINTKPQKLNNEKIGITTIDIATKNQMSNNEILIITSNINNNLLNNYDDNENVSPKISIKEIIHNIWIILKDKGPFGKRALKIMFDTISENKSLLSKLDTKWGFRNVGILLEDYELDIIFNNFHENGYFNYNNFLNQLKGYELNNDRLEIINKFKKLVLKEKEFFVLDEFRKIININNHPYYKKGLKLKNEIELELCQMWNKKENEKINESEIKEFLEDLSACMEFDKDYESFVLCMLN